MSQGLSYPLLVLHWSDHSYAQLVHRSPLPLHRTAFGGKYDGLHVPGSPFLTLDGL